MMLSELMQHVEVKKTGTHGGVPVLEKSIRGIVCDSRRVEPEFLFVAIPGERQDGHDYLEEAQSRGAAAAIVSRTPRPELEIPQLQVADSRRALADIAAHFYGDPSLKMRVIGITGTNGKTTVSYLLESILKEAGRQPGVVGTIDYRYAAKSYPASHTTPDAVDLQKNLASMLKAGVTDVVLEVSSHALSMERVRQVHFDVAAFTNLTQDHLDYHNDLESYFQAKRRLFTDYLLNSRKKEKVAVLNVQNARGTALAQEIDRDLKTLQVGLSPSSDLSCHSVQMSEEGIEATLVFGPKHRESQTIRSHLIGAHNLENILLAVGIAVGLKISPEAIEKGIAALRAVPGRLEPIENDRGLHIFVDYAHSPDAISRVGFVLRELATKRGARLWTLFGCGGDRDRSKRAMMGREAARVSDRIILTSDNPRTEDPEAILQEIRRGVQFENFPEEQLQCVVSREEALQKAVSQMASGDFLLVAGKGHEDYQIIGKNKVPFSDQEILKKAIRSL